MRRMQGEFYGPPPQIIRMMGNRTGVVEVEYIDYMVARNLLHVVDEWFKVIPTAVELKWLNWLRYRSHYIPRFSKFLTGVDSSTKCAAVNGSVKDLMRGFEPQSFTRSVV